MEWYFCWGGSDDNSTTQVQENTTIVLEDNTSTVLERLSTAESDYISAKANNNIYTRADFYNDIRINMDSEGGEISFANYENIDATYIYSNEGKLLEELPTPTYLGVEIELSSPDTLNVGEYYLIKYQSETDYYNYYYISQLTNAGFNELELYIVTSGETDESYEMERKYSR